MAHTPNPSLVRASDGDFPDFPELLPHIRAAVERHGRLHGRWLKLPTLVLGAQPRHAAPPQRGTAIPGPGPQPLPLGLPLQAKLRMTSHLFYSNPYLTNPANNLTRQSLCLPRASRITFSCLKARDCLAGCHSITSTNITKARSLVSQHGRPPKCPSSSCRPY